MPCRATWRSTRVVTRPQERGKAWQKPFLLKWRNVGGWGCPLSGRKRNRDVGTCGWRVCNVSSVCSQDPGIVWMETTLPVCLAHDLKMPNCQLQNIKNDYYSSPS